MLGEIIYSTPLLSTPLHSTPLLLLRRVSFLSAPILFAGTPYRLHDIEGFICTVKPLGIVDVLVKMCFFSGIMCVFGCKEI